MPSHLPALSKWSRKPDKNKLNPGRFHYSVTRMGVKWFITPITSLLGEPLGYQLLVWNFRNMRGYRWVLRDGTMRAHPMQHAFKTPQIACAMARTIHEKEYGHQKARRRL